jgi:hypothetical protein
VNINQTGDEVMTMLDELQYRLKQNDGIVTTAQANKAGVSNERLSQLRIYSKLNSVRYMRFL